MIFESSRDRLLQALTDRWLTKKITIGCLTDNQIDALEGIRRGKGWNGRPHGHVIVTNTDLQHMLKRIDSDKMTPVEVISLIECVLADSSQLIKGKAGRATLVYPDSVEIDNCPMIPHGVLMDGDSWTKPRLYGVIPKGWKGRQ